MMYIILSDGSELRFHQGDKVPEIWQPQDPKLERRQVVEIQADGEELVNLLNEFKNLPQCSKRVQRWFGDHARFIFHNL